MMSGKRFRVRFEQEDGRGEIVNEKGVELTAREVVDLLNNQNETLKSNYQREIQSSIDFCNAYSKTNGELLEKNEVLNEENNRVMDKLNELVDENEELKKKNMLLREEFIGIIHLLVNENDELTKKLDNAIDIARLNQETVKKLLNKLSKYWDDEDEQ